MTTRILRALLLLGFPLIPLTLIQGVEVASAAPGQEMEPSSRGSDWHLLELDELKADWQHYLPPTFNAYFPEQEKDGLALTVDSTVAKFFFWTSQVHGTATESQYKQVGLLMSVGVRVSRYVDLSINHHSQHILDGSDAWDRHFQSENWVNLRVYFFRRSGREAVL